MKGQENMPNHKYISHDEILTAGFKNPEFRKAYKILKPRIKVIGELVNLRVKKEISQKEFAESVGTHQSRISKIESANHDIKLSTLANLADALDADIDIRVVPRHDVESFFPEIDMSFCMSDRNRTFSSTEREPIVKKEYEVNAE